MADTWGDQLREVVQLTNVVESQMKSVISAYFDITDEGKRDFFEANFLNNSIINFAGKIKMVLAINKREPLITGLDRNPFLMLITRRNAFAHQDMYQSIRWEPPEDGSSRGLKFVVESMKWDGDFEVLTQEEAYAQFMDAFAKVHKCLLVMQGQLVGRKYAPQILGEKPGDS
jgi:hypothetical protein